MSETTLQRQLQKLVTARGGYIRKNHGNMLTKKGLADLSFTYLSLSFYWEVKTPEGYEDLVKAKRNQTLDSRAIAQSIHCRLAKNAGGITAIISRLDQARTILDTVNYCILNDYTIPKILKHLEMVYIARGLDDGTSY